jgi:hypothetical protein
MKRIIITLFFIITTVSSVNAMSVEMFEQMKAEGGGQRSFLGIYFSGLIDGYSWSNAFLRNRGDKQLYCTPPNIIINQDNAIQLVSTYIDGARKRGEDTTKVPVEVYLYFAMLESFPCPK